MVRRRRLLGEHIQRGARDFSRCDRVVQRPFVNQATAGAVDNANALLHSSKGVLTNEASRLRGQRRMNGNKIRTCKQLVKGRQLNLQITRLLRRYERIKSDYLHAERPRARGHSSPDSAQAYDAERFALQLDTNKGFSIPMA